MSNMCKRGIRYVERTCHTSMQFKHIRKNTLGLFYYISSTQSHNRTNIPRCTPEIWIRAHMESTERFTRLRASLIRMFSSTISLCLCAPKFWDVKAFCEDHPLVLMHMVLMSSCSALGKPQSTICLPYLPT